MEHLKMLKDSKLSTKEISTKLGVGERAVQKYLKGDREIPLTTKKLIEYEFGVVGKNEPPEPEVQQKKPNKQIQAMLKIKDEYIESLKKNIELLEDRVLLLKFQLSKNQRTNNQPEKKTHNSNENQNEYRNEYRDIQ